TGEWCSVAGPWHGCDPPHGASAIRTDGEVGSGERAIALDVIVGWLVNGTRGTGFEQPTTESEAVAAGAVGEETVVADAMEALRERVEQKTAGETVGLGGRHLCASLSPIVFSR